MSGDINKRLIIFCLFLMAGLYVVRWERSNTAEVYVREMVRLLDDRSHPGNCDFEGRRARLCQMVALLQDASEQGLDQGEIARGAANRLGRSESDAEVLADSLQQNTRSAVVMGLLDDENRSDMETGLLPRISRGPYAGGELDVEYIVPVEHAPELDSHFANMTLRPLLLTQELGTPVDGDSYEKAGRFYKAALISQSSYVRVGAEFEQNMRR